METIELIRLACYGINAVALFVLGGYFIREYVRKKLRPSLAWGVGFALFGIVVINLASLAAAGITKLLVMFGVVLTATTMSLLYYGAALLFFREGSFYREKMTVIIFLLFNAISSYIVYVVPVDRIAVQLRGPFVTGMALIVIVIGILFGRVMSRLPKEDIRRRTLAYVSIAWFILGMWLAYLALFWGEYPGIEAATFLLGSFGFLLLLYGMTTGKATKA